MPSNAQYNLNANKLTISVRRLAPASGRTLGVSLRLLLVVLVLLGRRGAILLTVLGRVLALRRVAPVSLLGRISMVLLHPSTRHAAILRAAGGHTILASALLGGVLPIVVMRTPVHATHMRSMSPLGTHHGATMHDTAGTTTTAAVERQNSISRRLGPGGLSRRLLLRGSLLQPGSSERITAKLLLRLHNGE